MILLGNTVPSCCPPQGHVQIIPRYPIDPTFPSGLDHCFGEWKCGDDSRDENLHEQNSKEGARLGPSLAFKSNIARSIRIYIYIWRFHRAFHFSIKTHGFGLPPYMETCIFLTDTKHKRRLSRYEPLDMNFSNSSQATGDMFVWRPSLGDIAMY